MNNGGGGNFECEIGSFKVEHVAAAFQPLYTAVFNNATDYYAFGSPMLGRKYQLGQRYRYGFQNQEEDPEIWGGAVSFKYRIEDPRLGRFFSVDPLTSDYPELTSYQFASNNPIWMNEIEGLEGAPYTDPMQAIWDGFGDGFIGIADWFDGLFSWGSETKVTIPVSTNTSGNATTESGIEIKMVTETTPQVGGTLRSLRNSGKTLSLDELPSSTKTESTKTVSGYNEVKIKKGDKSVTVKTTANQTEAKVEASTEASVKIKKIPLTVKGSASYSTKGKTEAKVEVSKSNSSNTSKIKASATYTSDKEKSNVKVSVGGEAKVGNSKVSTEKYVKVKTGG